MSQKTFFTNAELCKKSLLDARRALYVDNCPQRFIEHMSSCYDFVESARLMMVELSDDKNGENVERRLSKSVEVDCLLRSAQVELKPVLIYSGTDDCSPLYAIMYNLTEASTKLDELFIDLCKIREEYKQNAPKAVYTPEKMESVLARLAKLEEKVDTIEKSIREDVFADAD